MFTLIPCHCLFFHHVSFVKYWSRSDSWVCLSTCHVCFASTLLQLALQRPLSNARKLCHALAQFLIRCLGSNETTLDRRPEDTLSQTKCQYQHSDLIKSCANKGSPLEDSHNASLQVMPRLFKNFGVERAIQESCRDLLNVLDPHSKCWGIVSIDEVCGAANTILEILNLWQRVWHHVTKPTKHWSLAASCMKVSPLLES